jgi:hypothetical protein
MKNFVEDLENMNESKLVQVPGVKIKSHLDTWEKEIPVTNDEEINTFAVRSNHISYITLYRMNSGLPWQILRTN